MKIYYSETHKQHAPPFEFTGSDRVPTYETPERAENVLAELQKAEWADIHTPTDFGLEPVLSVHSQPYLDYLRTVYQRGEFSSPVPGMVLIPGTFDIRL